MGPTRELRGDKQKCPPSAFAHGLGGGRDQALALPFEFTRAAPAAEVEAVVLLRRPRPRAWTPALAQTWRCDAVENGGILRFLRIIDDMVSRLWQFPAGHDGHGTAPFNI